MRTHLLPPAGPGMRSSLMTGRMSSRTSGLMTGLTIGLSLGLMLGLLVWLSMAHAPARAQPAAAAAPVSTAAASAAELPPLTTYLPTDCDRCRAWVEQLRRHGLQVTVDERTPEQMPRIKRWVNVPSALASTQTTRAGRWFIEGPVPAADIVRLLQEQPLARGLVVPGQPEGAERGQGFDTLLIGPDGSSSLWARH